MYFFLCFLGLFWLMNNLFSCFFRGCGVFNLVESLLLCMFGDMFLLFYWFCCLLSLLVFGNMLFGRLLLVIFCLLCSCLLAHGKYLFAKFKIIKSCSECFNQRKEFIAPQCYQSIFFFLNEFLKFKERSINHGLFFFLSFLSDKLSCFFLLPLSAIY